MKNVQPEIMDLFVKRASPQVWILLTSQPFSESDVSGFMVLMVTLHLFNLNKWFALSFLRWWMQCVKLLRT